MDGQEKLLRDLTTHWGIPLPEAFRRLYRAFEFPFVSPCEFLPLEDLLCDTERWKGMLPQFLPFGREPEGGFYGFYASPWFDGAEYPVLVWDHEYDNYAPLSSSFRAFLGWCVVSGRYDAQDTFDESDPQYEEEERQRQQFAGVVGLPSRLLTDPLPRNGREMIAQLLAQDPQGGIPLLNAGCASLSRRDVERARDYFARASESAPWFADPYYLLAVVDQAAGADERAAERFAAVLNCLIALSTRTTRYDLGGSHPDMEIYEASADALAANPTLAARVLGDTPVVPRLLADDLYVSSARFALADEAMKRSDSATYERELLNALTLATDDIDVDTAYTRLIDFYHSLSMTREAERCSRDAELI